MANYEKFVQGQGWVLDVAKAREGFAMKIADSVWYGDEVWMITDTHGYPVKTLDLVRAIVIDPKRRYLDQNETRRNVSVKAVVFPVPT